MYSFNPIIILLLRNIVFHNESRYFVKRFKGHNLNINLTFEQNVYFTILDKKNISRWYQNTGRFKLKSDKHNGSIALGVYFI